MSWILAKARKWYSQRVEWARYRRDYDHFCRELNTASRINGPAIPQIDLFPILGEWTATTEFDTHYVYHCAWAARVLAETKPAKHIDISSSLYFSTICSAFVPVEFYDYRPAPLTLSGLICGACDLTKLPFDDDSIDSLSCLHVIEHLGLGRYGDPINPESDRIAAKELVRVLAKNGSLLIVCPIGRPRICFNAHRIYSFQQVVETFAPLSLKQFSLIADDAITSGLQVDAPPELADAQRYGCGCFWFQKGA
jgi:SAM-dependent methyltransferase